MAVSCLFPYPRTVTASQTAMGHLCRHGALGRPRGLVGLGPPDLHLATAAAVGSGPSAESPSQIIKSEKKHKNQRHP